jgi:hypothetical protein
MLAFKQLFTFLRVCCSICIALTDYNLVSPGCKGSTLKPIETVVAETYPYKSFDLSSLMNPLMFFFQISEDRKARSKEEKKAEKEKNDEIQVLKFYFWTAFNLGNGLGGNVISSNRRNSYNSSSSRLVSQL